MFFSDTKNMQYLCPSPHALVILHFFFSVTGLLSQRNALLPRYFSWRPRSCLFEGLAAAGNIICSMVGCVSHPHPFGVSHSSRLLAVLSGDELEANMWHRILAWCCHLSIGGHSCGARLTSVRRLTSARWSASQRQHSPGCCLCAYTRARSAYRSRYCGTGFVFFFFRCRNVGTVSSRSFSSPVFRGMWTSLVHLHLPLRSREVV